MCFFLNRSFLLKDVLTPCTGEEKQEIKADKTNRGSAFLMLHVINYVIYFQ